MRLAVVSGDGGVVYSYGELNARANRLARSAGGAGCGAGAVVALAFPRSPELVVAVLAVCKAGCGVSAGGRDYPGGAGTLHAPGLAAGVVLVTRLRGARCGAAGECPAVVRGRCGGRETLSRSGPRRRATRLIAHRLGSMRRTSYIQSGSTGVPKGVVTHHTGWSISSLLEGQGLIGPGSSRTRNLRLTELRAHAARKSSPPSSPAEHSWWPTPSISPGMTR
ncbi:AMP-binding protein [Streptomyces thioluteus]|uniref:AMP-binding protein n=1 Tax=Streptomyces thioluteus TaxID=66431 RepID=UPI003CD05B48